MENSLYRKPSFREATWYQILFKRRKTRGKFWKDHLTRTVSAAVVILALRCYHGGIIDFHYLVVYSLFILGCSFLPMHFGIIYRLHDTGRSGRYALLGLIPFVGTIPLIVLLLEESQKGSNKWGRDLNF